jgi:hypothetical protein
MSLVVFLAETRRPGVPRAEAGGPTGCRLEIRGRADGCLVSSICTDPIADGTLCVALPDTVSHVLVGPAAESPRCVTFVVDRRSCAGVGPVVDVTPDMVRDALGTERQP